MNRKEVGMRVRLARIVRGLSQRELAKRFDVSDLTISRIERGVAGIEIDQLPRLAEILGQSLDYFIQPPYSMPDWTPSDAIIQIPVLDQLVSAGDGVLAQEYVYVPKEKAAGDNIFALKAAGDCLIPEVSKGDVVICDSDRSPRDGSLVIIQQGDELMVKRYRHKKGEEWLESNDKRIEITDVEVKGVVIGLYRWRE